MHKFLHRSLRAHQHLNRRQVCVEVTTSKHAPNKDVVLNMQATKGALELMLQSWYCLVLCVIYL